MAKFYRDEFLSIDSSVTRLIKELPEGIMGAIEGQDLLDEIKEQILPLMTKERKKEDILKMITNQETGETFIIDLSLASEAIAIEPTVIYSVEDAKKMKVEYNVDNIGEDILEYKASLINDTKILKTVSHQFSKDEFERIVYEVVIEREEYDIMNHDRIVEVRKALVEELIEGHVMLISASTELKGLGFSYDQASRTIVQFFNQVSARLSETYVSGDIMNITDVSEKAQLAHVFFSDNFSDKVMYFTENKALVFLKEEELLEEMKSAARKIQESEILSKATDLKGNRKLLFDEIITPTREISRVQSIASQFLDLEF